MPNIKFEYFYRDEGNYKTFGELIFSNPNNLSLESIMQQIESNLIEGSCFDPDLWNIPRFNIHRHNAFGIHDYLWYEFDRLVLTQAPSKGQPIDVFLRQIKYTV